MGRRANTDTRRGEGGVKSGIFISGADFTLLYITTNSSETPCFSLSLRVKSFYVEYSPRTTDFLSATARGIFMKNKNLNNHSIVAVK